jgi:hypothetical protein
MINIVFEGHIAQKEVYETVQNSFIICALLSFISCKCQ